MKRSLIRVDGSMAGLLVGAVLVAMSLVACPPKPGEPTDGTCCRFTGPVAYDCASIENLGPGADLDGRCNAVNQGQSCSWDYSVEECCERAVNDGFGDVTCGPDTTGTSGSCCRFTGPVAYDCASIENLPPGGDLDGRCNAVNQGQSCSWFYGNDDCCKIAVDDGIPGSVVCN
jgi:hypothetical protein